MNAPGRLTPRARAGAFTLVELLVSMVVLSLLLVLLVQLTKATQQTWTYTVGKVEQFREAREAFESITRRLSQATLNTYWDYGYTAGPLGNVPNSYLRQSELRFISGNTTDLTLATAPALTRPTHAIFFQAPLGVVGLVNQSISYHGLDNLVNSWGYCIEYSDDSTTRPPFLTGLRNPPPLRNRFRLIEFTEPSESLSIYTRETNMNQKPPGTTDAALGTGGNAAYKDKTWFTDAMGQPGAQYELDGQTPRPVHVLAENIVALVLLPKLTKQDQTPTTGTNTYTDASLSPNYLYDSTLTSNASSTGLPDRYINPKNQLPALVQVTMVAVDEASYSRTLGNVTQAPDLTLNSGNPLFQTVGDTTNPDVPGYAADLRTLQNKLQGLHLTYRVFTTTVSIKAAKWSRDQTN